MGNHERSLLAPENTLLFGFEKTEPPSNNCAVSTLVAFFNSCSVYLNLLMGRCPTTCQEQVPRNPPNRSKPPICHCYSHERLRRWFQIRQHSVSLNLTTTNHHFSVDIWNLWQHGPCWEQGGDDDVLLRTEIQYTSHTYPIGSMYGIYVYAYICLNIMVNIGRYTIYILSIYSVYR